MAHTLFNGTLFQDRLRASGKRLFWAGFAMTVLGVMAIVFPIYSTLVATFLVGWVLLLFGILEITGSFSIHGTGPFFGVLLLGLLSTAAGIFLLFSPLAGAIALTLLAGGIFVVQSAVEISFAFDMRPLPGWGLLLVSGITSVIMAIIIIAGWPAISIILLGVLLGVNLLSTGFSYIFISRRVNSRT